MSQHEAVRKQRKAQAQSTHAKSDLQRAAVNSTSLSPDHARSESERALQPNVNDVLSAPGQPLDDDTRAFMEPRFGHDFSHVRVHTDPKAAESAQTVNALAYTVGKDMVFRDGHYAPQTNEGKRLLAHELTHVVQQESLSQSGAYILAEEAISEPSDPFEHTADQVADRIMMGQSIEAGNIGALTNHNVIQRQAPPVAVPIAGAAFTAANFLSSLIPAGSGGFQLTNTQFRYSRDQAGPYIPPIETARRVLHIDSIKGLGTSYAWIELVLRYDGENIIAAYTQTWAISGYEGGKLGSEAGVNFSAVQANEPREQVTQAYLLFEGFNNPSGPGFTRFNGRILVTGAGEIIPDYCRITEGEEEGQTRADISGGFTVGWR